MEFLQPGELSELMPTRELEIGKIRELKIRKEVMSHGAAYDDCDQLHYSNFGKSYCLDGSYGEEQSDWEQGLLVVQRAPYEVRPPIDTGVTYARSEADHNYYVSLNNSPKRPEYNWNSVRIDDTHPLCQACRDVFNSYCRYFEARLKVCRSFETFPPHKTKLESIKLESIKRSQRKIALDSNSPTPSCTISTFFLCLPGQILPNVTYVEYF